MKKIIIFLVVCSLTLAGCEQQKVPLKDTVESYLKEEAQKDECLIFDGLNVESGKSYFETFYNKVKTGQRADIRLVKYYDDFDTHYAFDIQFDGDSYTVSYYSDGALYVEEYQYLLHEISDGEPKSDHSKIEEVEVYYLVNDESLTYYDLMWSGLSSQSTDWVDYQIIYQETTYKE